MPKEITSLEEFKEIMQKTDGVIVVDSMALWCGPCSMIAPKIEKLAHDTPDVHFYKFDVDNVPKLSEYLNVTAMPTFFFFKNGETVGKVVGASLSSIKKKLSELN